MIIRALSYNIHGGFGVDGIQSYRRIGEFLASRQVDIALLQEFDTRSRDRHVDADMADLKSGHFSQMLVSPAVYDARGWYGNAVLTRFPVVFEQTIDVSQFGFQPRNIQEVIISTEDGQLHVLNTHKGLRRIERREQIRKLRAHLPHPSAMPILVGGDFNEWQLFSRRLRKLDSTLEAHRLGPTFPSRWPLFRLDRFWTWPPHMVHSARVLKTPETRVYSDHFPIEINLSLPLPA